MNLGIGLKSFLITLAIFIGIIISVFLYLLIGMGHSEKKAGKDIIERSIICDTIPFIDESPGIWLEGFDREEITPITFQILRNGYLTKDTVVYDNFKYLSENGNSAYMEIPYDYFLKTDTIVVTTNSGLFYHISGYHHYAYLHYGIFGYLGGSDCRLSDDCIVNNRETNGILQKKEGWVKVD